MSEESLKMDESVADWETGLPSISDLTPLSQSLIPAELASAFKISAETPRTMLEVNRASQSTFSSLNCAPNFKPYPDDHAMAESDSPVELEKSETKRIRSIDDEAIENCAAEQGKAVKRPRLVWTPQLHKRFVDVVAHLGLKNAVPKTIMQLMNVEGLTRENVASHLQKYRLYVKRMQSNEDPSPSDNLFASTPLPPAQSLNESSIGQANFNSSNNNSNVEMQMPIVPMSMMGMMATGNANSSGGFQGFEAGNSLHHHHHHHHHHYQQQHNNIAQQQRDWSGSKYNSNAYSHHVAQK